MLLAAIHGFVLALGLILPIGMQNSFILLQGSLHQRWSGSFPAVLTASLCDTLLVALSVIGVSATAFRLPSLRYAVGAIGILLMLYMGWSAWRSKDKVQQREGANAWTPKRQIAFALSVSLLNPHALIDTLAVIGGSAMVYTSWGERIAFAAACAAVSWIWFISLSLVGHLAGRTAIKRSSLRVLNRISAIMMWSSAIYLGYIVFTFQ